MRTFSPANVLRWYRGLPTWAKWAGIILLVALLVLAAVWWIVTGGFARSKPDTGKVAADQWDEFMERERDKARERDAVLVEEINAERGEREERGKEARERARVAEDDHEAIDTAGSICDINAVLADRRRERRQG